MTWEIVVGLITLVLFSITVVTTVGKLYKVLAKLEITMDHLHEQITDIVCDHKEWKTTVSADIKDHTNLLANHETRITVIEKKGVQS